MTREPNKVLPLILALFVGFGAGAVWRARGGGPRHPRGEHADHAADPAAMPNMDKPDMDMGDMDMGDMDMGDMDMGDMDMGDMDMGDMDMAAENVSYAINLANDTCPVMGNETDGEVYTHWQGLRVQFCCAGCEDGFLADPENALREAGVDPTAALEAIARLRATQGEEHATLLRELSSQFHVVQVGTEGDSR